MSNVKACESREASQNLTDFSDDLNKVRGLVNLHRAQPNLLLVYRFSYRPCPTIPTSPELQGTPMAQQSEPNGPVPENAPEREKLLLCTVLENPASA